MKRMKLLINRGSREMVLYYWVTRRHLLAFAFVPRWQWAITRSGFTVAYHAGPFIFATTNLDHMEDAR